MLNVSGLRKRFGSLEAVKGVSFEVPKGICYGLLGPNGAGKTTTISMIVGTLEPDGGSVTILGKKTGLNGYEAKRLIGYVPQEIAVYDELNALDNLRFFGSLYGLIGDEFTTRRDAALEVTSLTDRAAEPVKNYSGGMKRRLNIAIALLHRPELLILDEPTVGVDPQSRNAIFVTLRALQNDGMTLLYTTHYMEEVEKMCQRVAVMDHGAIVAEDSIAGLQRLVPAPNRVRIELESPPQRPLLFPDGVRDQELEGTTLTLEIEDLNADLPQALAALHSQDLRFVTVETKETSLEEVFLHLTGKNLRD
ncbi:MAG TPA: ABC transporter ATP-binding protein [Fimbriimonadaceae bacterium]|nr:ABC transporter ATP-binding protein [Fimbriimonadaceae bacterium]